MFMEGVENRSHLPSINGDDSNVLILAPKKKKTKKEKSLNRGPLKLKKKQSSKQSKSQKRKLKKLEEDKEKSVLLSKSLETLEKYKLQDDAYSLMWSSSSLGQVETAREKRRREMQFAKTGLVLQHSDRPSKRLVNGNGSCEIEPDSNEIYSDSGEIDDTLIKTMNIDTKIADRVKGSCVINPDSNIIYSDPGEKEDTPVQSMIIDTKIVDREIINVEPVHITSSEPPYIERDEDISALETLSSVKELDHEHTDTSMIEDPKASLPISSPDSVAKPMVAVSSTDSGTPMPKPVAVPTVVRVSRPEDVESKRMDLPIVMMEQEIMEAIYENISVIICGETGCGKTTQVPQFLYEAGFGSKSCDGRSGIIGVTQPRRVAVLATARRVAFELGVGLGKEVGFQVRHDKKIGDSCKIKFMTDGILLRELQNDFLLKRYSTIILDEAHERSLNTDILTGMLSRIIVERKKIHEQQIEYELSTGKTIGPDKKIFPLRLILMSATMRVEDFVSNTKIFANPPPVIQVPTRQYPVTVHFSKRTGIVDYIGQAYKKIMAIHKKLPSGGILVFVTGQREVEYLCRKLRKASIDMTKKKSNVNNEVPVVTNSKDLDLNEIDEAFKIENDQQTDRFSSYDNEDDCDWSDDDDDDESYESDDESDLEVVNDKENRVTEDTDFVNVLAEDGNFDSLKAAFEALAGKKSFESAPDDPVLAADLNQLENNSSVKKETKDGSHSALCVLPLYAMLPASSQLRVFEDMKEGERLVVVATNVAETSLTIPGIKYVVDTGREKVKNYNPSNGMETYEVQWISKASAAQRAGRAGRTGPGHCYRLYSSAVFNNIFDDFSTAEILKIPVDGVVLLMKSMGIKEITKFPFPTPPEAKALYEAELCLKSLEAIDCDGKLTPLGKAMSHYPMSPRHSRMLLTVVQILNNGNGSARRNLTLGYALAAAAALSLSNPFVMQFEGGSENNESVIGKEEKRKKKKLKECSKTSRAKFHNSTSDALTVAYALQCFELSENQVEFCDENSLHLKTMQEMSKLRKQLLHLVFNQTSTDTQQDLLWTYGKKDDVERDWMVYINKHPLMLNEEELLGEAICAGWADRVARRVKRISELSEEERKVNATRYQAHKVNETVFLHRWSSVSRTAPEFVVFSELVERKRPYIHGATSVKPKWLARYSSYLCVFSAPLKDPEPYYDPQTDRVYNYVNTTFGDHLWQLPIQSLPVKDEKVKANIFCCAMLDGKVLPCVKKARKFMGAHPKSVLKPEVSSHKRFGKLIYEIRKRNIYSCDMLRKVWDENARVLYDELLEWFQEGFRDNFDHLWEKMQREVRLGPDERFAKLTKKEKKRKHVC
ncbi:ATP-dependent RNA helicase DEAH13 [Rutidosis leptorrhynchoides]|uniref:ATP-dependent RNA helicase DEAH13 n=1 Tax=Rutidosis leptorrhynchoides TaxID=125765 RepID=UPI003A99DDCD